jgi:hypothetical protein
VAKPLDVVASLFSRLSPERQNESHDMGLQKLTEQIFKLDKPVRLSSVSRCVLVCVARRSKFVLTTQTHNPPKGESLLETIPSLNDTPTEMMAPLSLVLLRLFPAS